MNDIEIEKKQNDLFKWVITVMIGVLFTFTGIIYGTLKNADATAMDSITDLKAHETADNARFQNLEANVYLLCKAQKLDCIPPINN